MDFDLIAYEITNRIEKLKNKEKLTWKDVFENELNKLKDLDIEQKNIVLIRIVREISKRGYIIQDNPFKLVK